MKVKIFKNLSPTNERLNNYFIEKISAVTKANYKCIIV